MSETPLSSGDPHFSSDALDDEKGVQPFYHTRLFRISAASVAVLVFFAILIRSYDLHAFQSPWAKTDTIAVDTVAVANVTPELRPVTYTLRDLDHHPANMYPPFFLGQGPLPENASEYYQEFFKLLDIYAKRQGVDDNFTLRVMDSRTGELLELYTIDSLKTKYESNGYADWDAVDWYRRQATRQLVSKYVAAGIPREHISVRWGRANQVRESRLRKESIIEYELQLARSLGLSLLPTEIGTVETFNQDHLVSSAGARSRYQMMPNFLRSYQLNGYSLPSASGQPVAVHDELHPLLSLEPAFIIVRAYANAVGHEIPGISAYHTGPGNILNIYRTFLTQPRHLQMVDSVKFSVVDAFVWALTDGFPIVSERSSFRNASRGYIPAAMGTLRAVENWTIDPTKTLRLEHVHLSDGVQVRLSQFMNVLDEHGPDLDWGYETSASSSYDRFRHLNPHVLLPEPVESDDFPASGNVMLQRSSEGATVRFFLPIGATDVLADAGYNYIDRRSVFRYDENTYRDPSETGEKTDWDRAYEQLVDGIQHFGFTPSHRQRLQQISQHMDLLAELTPTRYRLMQARIARLHLQMWQSRPWNSLSETVLAVSGSVIMPPRPPHMPAARIDPRPTELSTHVPR